MTERRAIERGPLPDTSTPCGPQPRRARLLLMALLAAAALISAAVVLKFPVLSRPWRLVVALLPVPAYAYFLVSQIEAVRRTDELQQRIELEALVFAFPTTFVGILTTWLIWLAGFLPWLTFSDSVAFFLALMLGLHVLGRVLAARRYR